ncbi:MAG: hypothetical protein WBW73_07285, partial [Rhodoplanes sp.]
MSNAANIKGERAFRNAIIGALESRLWVTGCRDDGLPATDGLPLTADALLQRGETAKSTTRVNSLRKSTATY